MDKILLIDLAFLVVFCIGLVIFLSRNKKNLKREGIIYLYRTKLGMNAINKFSEKYSKLLKSIKYLVIAVAFVLMIAIILLLASNAVSYIKSPQQTIAATNGAPPIAPLIPYFPQIFGLQSFFPNFYFSYFIIALAIVAIVHEFSHGVFMKTFGIKIKSTGFLFLGPILGAFVEEDKNTFEKKKNSEQMATLGAGVFANFVFVILFFIILVLFFNLAYVPAGYVFSSYAQTSINSSSIVSFENYSGNLIEVKTANDSYFISKALFSILEKNQTLLQNTSLVVYGDHPAIRNELRGAIVEVNGAKITKFEDFQEIISNSIPGEKVLIKTIHSNEELQFEITLSPNPLNSSRGFLGIGHQDIRNSKNLLSKVVMLLNFKNPSIFYQSRFNPEATEYFYYLIWWTALINLFVALFNMLPIGILDGGRFTYLLFLSITKSEKKSKKIYKIILSTVGIIFLLLVLGWFFARFSK